MGNDIESLPTLTAQEQHILAEFIKALAEVRRLARQLEADQKVTMSRAPRVLHELYEALLVMGGDMEQNSSSYYPAEAGHRSLSTSAYSENISGSLSFPCIQSFSGHCEERDTE